MEVAERLKLFSEKQGITPYRIAKDIGVETTAVCRMFKGRNDPSATTLKKILLIYPNLNARWLITGDGKMFDGVEGGAVLESADKS